MKQTNKFSFNIFEGTDNFDYEALNDNFQKIDEGVLSTQEEVDKWLNEHPEITTTVQDRSLTIEKFTDDLALRTLKDYVTPQMFGAKGDGVTDDTEAIKQCIGKHDHVYFPRGNYIMNEPLTIDKEGLVIIGDDAMTWGKTCITFNSCDGVVFNVARYGAFKGISIKANTTENEFCGFKFNAKGMAHKYQIENCMIFNFKYGISDSVGDQKCTIWNCSFKHIRTNNVEYAIYLAQADYSKDANHFGVMFEDVFSDAGKVYLSSGKYTFLNCNFGIRCSNYLKLYSACYTTWINCNFECDEAISSGYCLEINGKEHLFINCQFAVKGASGVYFISPKSDLRMLKFIGCYSWTDGTATIWHTFGDYGTAGCITFTGNNMEKPKFTGSYYIGGYNTNAENGLVSAYDTQSTYFPDNFMYWSPTRKELSYFKDGVINDAHGNDIANKKSYPIKIGGGFYLDGGEIDVTNNIVVVNYNRIVNGNVFVSNPPIIDDVPIMILRDESANYKDRNDLAVFKIKMWDASEGKWVNNTKSFTLKWFKISL